MYTNQNNSSQRRNVKRYNPGHSGRATRDTIIVLAVVFLIGCAVGAVVGIGIFKAANPGNSGDTIGTVDFVDPSVIDVTTPESTTNSVITDKKLICIDPGHGYIDGGAVSNLIPGTTEYEINMKFSKLLKAELEARGFQVVLTHDGTGIPKGYDYNNNNMFEDVCTVNGVSKSERRDYAMSLNPDYFIAIHCNSYPEDSKISGMMLYYEGGNLASGNAASCLTSKMSAVEKIYTPAKTVRAEAKFGDEVYAVTNRWGSTPAVLCELGYMSGQVDSKLLQNADWLVAVSKAYADGILEYFMQ